MDGLGPALFGLFLVSFTVSKPVSQCHQLTLSSSESSESNESSSSEEITVPRTTIEPIELNTMRPEDNQNQTSDHTAHPGLALTTPHPGLALATPDPANTGQRVVELGLETSLGPLQSAVADLATPHPGLALTTPLPGLALATPDPANTGQRVVELGLETSLGPLQSAVADLVSPEVTSPELQCYTVELTSPEPKPPRGDNVY